MPRTRQTSRISDSGFTISPEQRLKIISLLRGDEMDMAAIGRRFSVAKTTIYRINEAEGYIRPKNSRMN